MNSVRILHLNIGKRKAAQSSLFNDTKLKNFSAISVVEPYIFVNPENDELMIPQDRTWQCFQPTTRNHETHPRHSFRSVIWTHTKIRASQITVDCHDITAIVMHLDKRSILLISCYDPRDGATLEEREEALGTRTDMIIATMARARTDIGGEVDTIICADLNRHHTVWGGRDISIQHGRRTEGDKVVNFMHETSVQSMLKPGIVTWEHPSLDQQSTIDLVLGSSGIQEKLITCDIHPIDHGSDHKAIATNLGSELPTTPQRRGKRQYSNADWNRVRARLKEALNTTTWNETLRIAGELDQEAEKFTTTTNEILEDLVPRARQSPYNKRWWTAELTELRNEYTARRNRITTLRRRGEDTERARSLANAAKRTFHNAISRQKQDHWKEFLDNPENVWKAAK